MTSHDQIILDGESLTIEQVAAVTHGTPGKPEITISEKALEKVAKAAKAVEKLLERNEIAYGITTGFGAFKDRIISKENVEKLQRNILLSHAVGTGDPFDVATTRAIMLIRANTLVRGFSGIRPETVQLLVNMLNGGIHPVIPEKGSLGASGDLAPLAHMSLVLIGEGEAEYEGKVIPGEEALGKAGLKPVTLAAKEGLSLTNGTAVMCALGSMQAVCAERLAKTADITACLSLEALNGTQQAYDKRIHELRPMPRQTECASFLRTLLRNSDFTRPHDPADIQDAYSLRCVPQVHGAVRDAIAYLRWVMEIELNAVTDNPLVFIDEESGRIDVVSGGNFHGEPLAIALDYLTLAMTELGNMSERRLALMVDEAANKGTLPSFLIEDGGLNSGFMIIQYTAASLATENKALAHPASVDNIPTSANVEDHVSMGCTAGLQARQVNANVEHILALELFAAAQGVDFRKKELPETAQLGTGTKAAFELVREVAPFIQKDTRLTDYIDAIKKRISDNDIVRGVDSCL